MYSIQMNIVSDLDEWHDMISGSAFTTAPGCEAILEPTVDPPEYEQVLTGVLEQIRYQSITQRQQGDPRRHSTPQNSRESVFNSDITMIAGNAGQGMAALSNFSVSTASWLPATSPGWTFPSRHFTDPAAWPDHDTRHFFNAS